MTQRVFILSTSLIVDGLALGFRALAGADRMASKAPGCRQIRGFALDRVFGPAEDTEYASVTLVDAPPPA